MKVAVQVTAARAGGAGRPHLALADGKPAIPVRYTLRRAAFAQVAALGLRRAALPRDEPVRSRIREVLDRCGLGDRLCRSDAAGGRVLLLLAGDGRMPPAAAGRPALDIGPLLLAPAVLIELVARLPACEEAVLARLERHLGELAPAHEDWAAALHTACRPRAGDPCRGRGGDAGASADGRLFTLGDIVGCSPALRSVKELVAGLHDSDATVLLIGDSGTGKELFAQAIHAVSWRRRRPFVAINCAAIPASLIESELFGFEDGAFTGARRGGHPGLFERADGGTVFLDEIGDMPLGLQGHLLRLLEDRRILRIGGTRCRPVDVRIVAATNHPLDELMRNGVFRQDLFFRLCVIPLHLPPLRERSEDIPLLVRHFLAAMGETRPVAAATMADLLDYGWPGNVRELRHALEYMRTVASDAPELRDLPPHIRALRSLRFVPAGPAAAERAADEGDGPEAVDRLVLEIIERHNAGGHGIGRRRLAREIRGAGVLLGEGEIRTRLAALKGKGLVDWGVGRSGAKLSARARALLAGRCGTPRSSLFPALGPAVLGLANLGTPDGLPTLLWIEGGPLDQIQTLALHAASSSWMQHAELVLASFLA
jgi:hypothetical protein